VKSGDWTFTELDEVDAWNYRQDAVTIPQDGLDRLIQGQRGDPIGSFRYFHRFKNTCKIFTPEIL